MCVISLHVGDAPTRPPLHLDLDLAQRHLRIGHKAGGGWGVSRVIGGQDAQARSLVRQSSGSTLCYKKWWIA